MERHGDEAKPDAEWRYQGYGCEWGEGGRGFYVREVPHREPPAEDAARVGKLMEMRVFASYDMTMAAPRHRRPAWLRRLAKEVVYWAMQRLYASYDRLYDVYARL